MLTYHMISRIKHVPKIIFSVISPLWPALTLKTVVVVTIIVLHFILWALLLPRNLCPTIIICVAHAVHVRAFGNSVERIMNSVPSHVDDGIIPCRQFIHGLSCTNVPHLYLLFGLCTGEDSYTKTLAIFGIRQ